MVQLCKPLKRGEALTRVRMQLLDLAEQLSEMPIREGQEKDQVEDEKLPTPTVVSTETIGTNNNEEKTTKIPLDTPGKIPDLVEI